jgi:ABC-type transport system substrate-binding protein
MAMFARHQRTGFAIAVLALTTAVLPLTSQPGRAETVLRIAMTAADIPDWRGQPDQGFEGSRFVGYSLYDGLVGWDLSKSDREADIKPALATKWSSDPNDNKKWTFELRKGVKFHDGCDWNADSAVWNYERLTLEKNPAFTPYNFGRGRSRSSNIDRVEKVDDYTIVFYTKTPESMFPYNTAYLFMISKCAVEAAGNNLDVFAKNPSGTGPYKFASVVPHERFEMVKNTDYWDKDRIPKHDRMVLLPMPEVTTRVAALLAGQVDLVEAPSPDTIPALKAAGMNIVTNIYPHFWPYLLNADRPPFKDIRVRQAANYAMNRGEMVELLSGVATPSSGVFIPAQKFYGKPIQYGYDPKKATALLKEAGCYPCEIFVGISTSGSGQMQPLPMNELVKEQLEAVGFKVKFDTLDWNTLLDIYFKGQEKFPYHAINFSSGTMDPVSFLKGVMTQYKAPYGANWGWYSNPEVDALGEKALASADPATYIPLVRQVHEIIVRDARSLFIVSDLNPRALSPKLKGFVQAQSWFQDMTPITISP